MQTISLDRLRSPSPAKRGTMPRDITLSLHKASPPPPPPNDIASPIHQSDATAARMANASSAREQYLKARKKQHAGRGRDESGGGGGGARGGGGRTPRGAAAVRGTRENNDYRMSRDTAFDVTEGPTAGEMARERIELGSVTCEPSRRDRLADAFNFYQLTGNRNVLTDTIYDTSVDAGTSGDAGRGGWETAALDSDHYVLVADAVDASRARGGNETAPVSPLSGSWLDFGACYAGVEADPLATPPRRPRQPPDDAFGLDDGESESADETEPEDPGLS